MVKVKTKKYTFQVLLTRRRVYVSAVHVFKSSIRREQNICSIFMMKIIIMIIIKIITITTAIPSNVFHGCIKPVYSLRTIICRLER